MGVGGLLRRLVDTEDSCEAANMIQREAQGRGRKVTGVEAGGGKRRGGRGGGRWPKTAADSIDRRRRHHLQT